MASGRSDKAERARNSLPESLWPIFDQFVEEYKFAALIHHGSAYVSYSVLAELVKAGWRPTGEPMGQWKKPVTSPDKAETNKASDIPYGREE